MPPDSARSKRNAPQPAIRAAPADTTD